MEYKNSPLISDDFLKKVPELKEVAKRITPEEINVRSIKKEYQLIKKITSTPEHKKKLEKNPDYLPKFRYKEIPSYSKNLVTTDGKDLNKQNFINANFIPDIITKKKEKNLIVTQGPLEETLEDFWKMVETKKTKIIVAIIEKESLNKKCYKYWPENSDIKIGNYLIKIYIEKKNKIYDYKKFVVENQKNGNTFEIEHYHIFKWNDYGIVEEFFWNDLYDFLNIFLDKFFLYNSPIIHCSAGIGRSGTFLALFFLFFEFKNSQTYCEDFNFSVFNTVRQIREFRWQAIESQVQYKFLYDFLQFMVKK